MECNRASTPAAKAPSPTNGCKSAGPSNSSPQRPTHDDTGRSSEASANLGAACFNINSHESYDQNSFQCGPFPKASGASTAAQAASVVQQAHEKAKREREEAQEATERVEALRRKHQASKKPSSTGYPNPAKRRGGKDDAAELAIRNMLVDNARKEILKYLSKPTVAKPAVKEPVDTKNGAGVKKPSGISGARSDITETMETMSINVPDPDFHDFDKDRSETCFGENQVWAAYDSDNVMPRYYALVQNVISFDPFSMRISWLNSKTNSELGPLNWVSSGFSKTCGNFQIGKYEVNKSLNSFSHRVQWTKGPRGTICIYPRKGDVWALYRKWSPDWNELTPDEVIHMYDMVEVVEDYNKDMGVIVTPLVKMAGFKTVFHRQLDPKEARRIPREEMFRFSHHVPAHLLTGQEAPNAPKGCWELDPAATPLEVLQEITDVKAEEGC